MAQKKVKTRIQNKHDTTANWQQANNFTPLPGELIIYDYNKIKIGNGEQAVQNLPFCNVATPIEADQRGELGTNTPYGASYVEYFDSYLYSTQVEFYNIETAPIGFTYNFYKTLSYAESSDRYFDTTIYLWGCAINAIGDFQIHVMPSKCIFPEWCLTNTVSDSLPDYSQEDPDMLHGVGISAGYNFKLYLPSDKDSSGNYLYNQAVVGFTLTKITDLIFTVEPKIYLS